MAAPKNPLEAKEYAKLTGFDGKWRETWWRDDFLSMICRRCGLESVQTILDVGCGVGHWSRTLSRVLPSGLKISGIDIEPSFIERAVELGRGFGLRDADYRVGCAEAIPFADQTFDLVTCQTVLIHVKDPLAVLREMHRVLKPGGAVLVAEPNNLVGYLSFLSAEPRLPWLLVKDLLEFYQTCLCGKIALGMGDSSVGDRLPSIIAKAGFNEISVAINENCPALIPPYDSERQQIELEFLQTCIASENWMGFGPRENSLRFFREGGGGDARFNTLWALAIETQRQILAKIQTREFSGGRGSMMYLITAKTAKPALQDSDFRRRDS